MGHGTACIIHGTQSRRRTLEQYLSGKIFGGETGTVMEPDPADVEDLMLILKTIKRHWKQKWQR